MKQGQEQRQLIKKYRSLFCQGIGHYFEKSLFDGERMLRLHGIEHVLAAYQTALNFVTQSMQDKRFAAATPAMEHAYETILQNVFQPFIGCCLSRQKWLIQNGIFGLNHSDDDHEVRGKVRPAVHLEQYSRV